MKIPHPMLFRRSVWSFLLFFAVIFGALSASWPPITEAYSHFFQTLALSALASEKGPRALEFEPPDRNSPRDYDARIVIINRALMHSDGSGPVRNLDIALGRIPTALLLALILATPVSWSRRTKALFFGLVLFHVTMLLVLNFLVWNESSNVALIALSPPWKQIADLCERTLAAQFSPIVPVLVWIVVTLRQQDLESFRDHLKKTPFQLKGVSTRADLGLL